MQTQVENFDLLVTSFGQAVRALELTCNDLRWLTLTSVAIKVKPNFHSLLSFHAPGWSQGTMRGNFSKKQSTKATTRPQARKRSCTHSSSVSPTRLSTMPVRCTVLPIIVFLFRWKFMLIIYIFQVLYPTRETVFHRDIQTSRRELKIRRTAEYFWRLEFEVFR